MPGSASDVPLVVVDPLGVGVASAVLIGDWEGLGDCVPPAVEVVDGTGAGADVDVHAARRSASGQSPRNSTEDFTESALPEANSVMWVEGFELLSRQ